MSISPTGIAGAIGGATGATAVDKDAFMKLLVLQLQNQDPLNPMENEQMLAQLAQFSSLEQMQEMNANIATNVSISESLHNTMATSLIGKDVVALGDTIRYDGEKPVTVTYAMQSLGTTTLRILDEAGAEVHRVELGQGGPGWDSYTWEPGDLPAGPYRVEVLQVTPDGDELSATTFISDRVDGVRFEDGVTYLSVGGRSISLSDVLEINHPSEDA